MERIKIKRKDWEFIYRSEIEREMLSSYLSAKNNITDLQYSPPHSTAKWDAYFVSGATKCLVEVKVLSTPFDKHPNEIIRQHKFEYFINSTQDKNVVPLLIIFNTDQTAIYNLTNYNHLKYHDLKFTDTTSGVNQKVIINKVKYLPKTTAIQLGHKINRLIVEQYCLELMKKKYIVV
jgi:hypothetical protein